MLSNNEAELVPVMRAAARRVCVHTGLLAFHMRWQREEIKRAKGRRIFIDTLTTDERFAVLLILLLIYTLLPAAGRD